MAFIGRTTATRGALIRLRDNLEFIRNGMEILKMKRDSLARELNGLLGELNRREEAERQLMLVYEDLKAALAVEGFAAVSFAASSISKMKVDVNPISIMGVVVPKITLKEKPQMDSIENVGLYEVAEKLQVLFAELLNVAQVEASIERVAYELMMINRKVNALEKVIIPAYAKLIRHIENLLFDEDLEEFARIKHFRDVSGRKRT
jgi:V/A-type H+-transporting ATPase subunit D